VVTSQFLSVCSGAIEDFALLGGFSSVAGYVVPKVSKETIAYILMGRESEDEDDASFETSVNPYSSTQRPILMAVNLGETSTCDYIRNVALFPVVFRKCLSFRSLLYLTLYFLSSRRRDAHSVVHWTPKNEDVLLPVLGSTSEECNSASISPYPARWVTAVCVILLCGDPVQTEALRSDQLGLLKKFRTCYGTRGFAALFTWPPVTCNRILFRPCWQRNFESKRRDDIRRHNVQKEFQKIRQCINKR
jgi:hypothetical protein